jgi:hypothetical protein
MGSFKGRIMWNWIKQNWLNIVLTVLATKFVEAIWSTSIDIPWKSIGHLVLTNASFQAFVLSAIVTAGLLVTYFKRHGLNFEDPDGPFRMIFGGLSISYFTVFALSMFTGNLDSLIADIKIDPFSKIFLIVYVIYLIGRDIYKKLKYGPNG